jgi:hypothetical protein
MYIFDLEEYNRKGMWRKNMKKVKRKEEKRRKKREKWRKIE